MGNCCGKESPNFAGPGRTLGSAPPTARSDATTLPPARPHNYGATQSKPATQGQGRTLGTAGAADANDPRSAAAKAAEARVAAANSKVPKSQRQTNRATLEEASYTERRQRDADAMADARAWN
ncbi:hypothetical protein IWX90DRAFT_229907 [Phyllosticta citrichinensis]|uniref:Uncharacterized protein n=1 Tax=Phyllosticta citrichinensis TaxID=1130410 RepID=A0ABR1XUI4_9PEZI